MTRGGKTIGAALIAVALAAGLMCVPVSAEQIDWQPGPATVRVVFDTTTVTEGIPAGDVDELSFTGAVCFTPEPVPGEWNGGGVTVTVDTADTGALTCTVRASVRYCYWVLWRRTCDGVRVVDLQAEGGPLHLDSANPVVTGAHVTEASTNAKGWFRSAGVIRWSGRDEQSGIESCATAVMKGTDTLRTTVVGLCRDRSGHASETLAYTYKLDATPPTLHPAVHGTARLGAPAGADPVASDETSGIAAAVCNGGAPLDTSETGRHTVLCSAVDAAGNTASATTTYTVGYGFAGSWFAQPGDPAQRPAPHPVRAGTSVALMFRVTTDTAGTPLEHLDPARVTVRVTQMPCGLGGVPETVSGGVRLPSGLADLGAGRYRLVWPSRPGWAGSCGRLTLDLGDGVPHLTDLVFLQ